MTLRRGWYWGTQSFRKWLEAKVKAGEKPSSRGQQATEESRASHDLAEAERLVVNGMKALRLSVEDIIALPGSDPKKVAIAKAIQTHTSVPQSWTAQRLGMKSAANVSQQLRRLSQGKIALAANVAAWLSRMVA